MSKTHSQLNHDLFLDSVDLQKIRSVFPEIDAHVDYLSEIQNHKYKNKKIAVTSFLHRSALVYWPTNKVGVFSFEKLEFLGDALVNYFVAEQALMTHPHMNEGSLSKLRAFVVGTENLAHKSTLLDLGSFILFGKSESRSPYKTQNNILADAFESITAALFLDAGHECVKKWLMTIFYDDIVSYKENISSLDSKGKLQQWIQEIIAEPPFYKTIEEQTINNQAFFTVGVYVGSIELSRASGKNKKDASKAAAAKALELIEAKTLTAQTLLGSYGK